MNANSKNFRLGKGLRNSVVFLFFFMGFILLNNQIFAATYYIDPTSTASGTRDGSIEHPYLSWDNVTWTAGSTYLQKRGTENVVTKVLKPAVSDITFGAYGTGARPIIKTTVGNRAKGVEINGANITIKDLEIYSINEIVCAIILGGAGPFVIDNCVLHHCAWGIRAFNLTGKLTLSNTEIYSTGDDGVYTEDTQDIEIFGCYVHHVNSDLPVRETAGGDCIQITGAQGYLNIHDNILDHSAFGRKFCLIIGSALDGRDVPSDALVERNTMIGFQGDSDITSGLYLKESIANLIFRYNTVKDAATGLWMNANTTAHNNTFIRCWQGITVNANKIAKLYNNTFVNNETGIKANYGSTNYIYNNIFHSGTMTKEHYSLNGTITSDYNCFDANGTGFYGGGANTLAEVQSGRNRDLHSFVSCPLFQNINQDDFRLTAPSPCIDKGMVVPESIAGKVGNAVVKGTLPDIGAIEYEPIGNSAPVVTVKAISDVYAGILTTIDGSGTYDADNDTLTYKWIVPVGVSISSSVNPVVKILAQDINLPAKYTIQLQVSDGQATVTKDIPINVINYKAESSEIKVITLTASKFQSPNYPENLIDNNVTTRWAAQGSSEWVIFEMQYSVPVDYIKVLFYSGDTRKSYFELYASKDKITWDQIMTKTESCGFSVFNNVFPFNTEKSAVSYKYIKLVGKGSNVNNWNSMYEFHIFGNILNAKKTPSVLVENQLQDFGLYPNPASEYFSIQLDEMAENLTVQIIDLNGKVVMEENLYDVTESQISIQSLTTGIYYVRLASDKKAYQMQKLIVK